LNEQIPLRIELRIFAVLKKIASTALDNRIAVGRDISGYRSCGGVPTFLGGGIGSHPVSPGLQRCRREELGA
jgi:hypothetical protein